MDIQGKGQVFPTGNHLHNNRYFRVPEGAGLQPGHKGQHGQNPRVWRGPWSGFSSLSVILLFLTCLSRLLHFRSRVKAVPTVCQSEYARLCHGNNVKISVAPPPHFSFFFYFLRSIYCSCQQLKSAVGPEQYRDAVELYTTRSLHVSQRHTSGTCSTSHAPL